MRLKLLLLVIFLNQLLWIAAIPYNFAPDEFGHFDAVQRIVYKQPPPADGLVQRDGMISVSYSIVQPLPYLWSSLFMWQDHYLFARLGSAVAICLAVAILYWFLKDWRAALLFGLIPQVTFIGSYVTSDAMALMVAAAITALFFAPKLNPWVWGITLGVGLLSRFNLYPLIAVVGLVQIWRWFKQRQIKAIIISSLVALVISGWWFIQGLPNIQRFYAILGEIRAYEFHNYSLWQLVSQTNWLEITAKSAFAAFDWNYLFLPNWMYAIALVVFVFGIFQSIQKRKINGWMVLAIGLTIYQSLAQSAYGSYQPQGRHLFAVLPLVVYLVWQGWGRRLRTWVVWGMITVNGYALFQIILPRYWAQGMQLTGLTFYRQVFWEMVFNRPIPFNLPGFTGIVLVWLACLLWLAVELAGNQYNEST